jgi:glucose/arabinose dehydrogenase
MSRLRLFSCLTFFLFVQFTAQSQYPEGFQEEIAFDQFGLPAGILFANDSISVVWELDGKVWVIINGNIQGPVIDITEEVALFGDLGMIGAALDPDFETNGHIYLFYCVDSHYLRFFGTPEYDPGFSAVATSSMGRITRYTLNTEDYSSLIPDSRFILLGDSIGNGPPIAAPAHGVGNLMFGEDGSLIATMGDGNTWVGTSGSTGFNGEGPPPAFAFDDEALEWGILKEEEDLGAFRAQYMDGLNGKILRLNPENGEGLPNNPFFNPEDPDSPRSKIYALGFRNPYRFTIKTGTGGGDLNTGSPGTIVLSDVGDWVWEEVNFVIEGGGNYGWPMYQGPVVHNFYNGVPTTNINAPNPLAGEGCSSFMDYQNIIIQDNFQHEYFFPNPCNSSQEIGDEILTFVHQRPALSFANSANQTNPIAALSTFDENGAANFTSIEDSPEVEGENFTG